MKRNNLYKFTVYVRNLNAAIFKVTAKDIFQAHTLITKNLIGDDYTLADLLLIKNGTSKSKKNFITTDF